MLVLALAAVAGLLVAGCTTPDGNQTAQNGTVNVLYSQGVGPMPNLLATSQIDGYIAWQPFASIATESKIAQLVESSQKLPPAGMWENHPCCVLSAREDLLASNPDFVNAISALTQLGSTYIAEHPGEAAEILADWFVGRSNFTYGSVSVASVDVMKDAIPTVKYTNEPTADWIANTKEFVTAQKDLGLVTTLGLSRERARFDANLGRHHHFVCTRCGLTRDIQSDSFDSLDLPDSVKTLGRAESIQVEVRGLCIQCAACDDPGAKKQREGKDL